MAAFEEGEAETQYPPAGARMSCHQYRSEEWAAERSRVYFTGSTIGGALGVTSYLSARTVVQRVLHAASPSMYPPPPPVSPNPAITHGTVNEPRAIEFLCTHVPLFRDAHQRIWDPPMFTSPCGLFGCTPDGVLQEREGGPFALVEIKCPYFSGEPYTPDQLPMRHIAQCFLSMRVMHYDACYLVWFGAPSDMYPDTRPRAVVYKIVWDPLAWAKMLCIIDTEFMPLCFGLAPLLQRTPDPSIATPPGSKRRFSKSGPRWWTELGISVQGELVYDSATQSATLAPGPMYE